MFPMQQFLMDKVVVPEVYPDSAHLNMHHLQEVLLYNLLHMVRRLHYMLHMKLLQTNLHRELKSQTKTKRKATVGACNCSRTCGSMVDPINGEAVEGRYKSKENQNSIPY
jgi:hypothetical protein